jgi:hypothetical protein
MVRPARGCADGDRFLKYTGDGTSDYQSDEHLRYLTAIARCVAMLAG